MQKNDFNINNLVSNAHVTNNRVSLVNYLPLETPIEIKFNVLGDEISAKVIGVRTMPVLFNCKKKQYCKLKTYTILLTQQIKF